MPQSQTRTPHWWLSVWKQSKHFPKQFTVNPLRLKFQTGTFQVKKGMPFGYSFPILDCLSVKQLITDQVVGLNNDAALKKKEKGIPQHLGKYKMHPLHEGNFHPWHSLFLVSFCKTSSLVSIFQYRFFSLSPPSPPPPKHTHHYHTHQCKNTHQQHNLLWHVGTGWLLPVSRSKRSGKRTTG